MTSLPPDSESTWEFHIHPETAGYLISRSTILLLCGVLAGILLSFQLTMSQRMIAAGSCMVGIIAFLTVDGGINSRLLAHNRRLRETRDTLNRRIDLQLAFLDAQIRESTPPNGIPSVKTGELVGAAASNESSPEPL